VDSFPLAAAVAETPWSTARVYRDSLRSRRTGFVLQPPRVAFRLRGPRDDGWSDHVMKGARRVLHLTLTSETERRNAGPNDRHLARGDLDVANPGLVPHWS
jgi:hypothetical protein